MSYPPQGVVTRGEVAASIADHAALPSVHHAATILEDLVELTYTTWAIQAIYDTGVALSSSDKLGIGNNGNVYWHDQSAKTVYIISSAAALLATLDGSLIVNDYFRVASVLDRYKILAGTWSSLIVQEGITKLWERDVTEDEGAYTLNPTPPAPIDPGLLAISPSGEWIAAIVKEATTGNGLIFIYKGG